MLDPSSILLWFDLPSLFKFLFTLLLFGIAAVYLVRDTASRYLIAGETRVPDDEDDEAADDLIGSGTMGDQILTTTVDENCFVCGGETTKKCSRCKAVRYCSSRCQSKDWAAGHSKRCRKIISGEVTLKVTTGCMDKRDDSSSQNGTRNIPGSASSVSSGCKIIKQPKEVLYPYDDFLELFDWNKTGLPPCGLLNCGNSCFANVVLQCLTSTRPLIAYLLERDHARECTRYDWCFLCELRLHVVRVKQSFEPFSPRNILSRIFNVGGSFGYGKQEDAHEFMRFAIDTMQSVCLDEFGGEKNLDSKIQETTLIHHIFGGHLQSQVICSKCGAISNRYEKMMDLTVEIHGNAGSLEECLDQFTSKEWLEGDNMYKCDICNDYVRAWKRLTIYQAPNILTIALKRFQSGRFGKLNKRVSFPETLDLGSYMGGSGDSADIYKLYAVVVHVDMLNASYFGHYICYTKDSNGIWYRIDDCKVMEVDLEEVLSQRAYMLLYSRVHARKQIAEAAPKSQNTNDTCTQKAANGTQSIADIVEASLISHSASPTSLVLPTEMSELDSQLISEPVVKSMDACQMSSRDASLEIGVPGNSPLRNSEDTSFQCSSEAADITSHEDTTNVLSNGELHEEARSPNNGALNSLEHSTYPSTGQTSLETEAHLVSNAEVNSLEPSRSSCTDQISLETETHMLSNDELNPLEHSISIDQSSLEKDADISLTTPVGVPYVTLSSEATEAAMSSPPSSPSLDDAGSKKSTQSNGVLVHEDRNDPIVEDENGANGMTVEVQQPRLSCLPTGAASLNGSLEDLCMNDEIEHHSPSSNGSLIDKQEHLKAKPAHKRNVKPAFAPGFLNKPPKKKPSVNGDRSHSRMNGAAESSNAEAGVLKSDQSADSRALMNGDRNSVLSNGFARPAVNNLKSCSANNGSIAVGGASEGCGIGMDLADNCKRRRAAATK